MRSSAPLLFAVLLLVSAVSLPEAAHAGTGLTIQPVKVSETLAPGQEVSGTILLSNASEEDVEVDLDVQDFIPTAGAETIQFVGRTEGLTTVRDWITLDGGAKSFILKQGESKNVPYTIKAPENAEPGGHFGVAFFKAVKLSELNSQIKIGTQVGVLVFVTIPGSHLQKGTILDFTAPTFVNGNTVPFGIRFENTGTVHFEPKGAISITDMFGKEVGTVPIQGQVVLPTGIKNLTFAWETKGLLVGRYVAKATIQDGDGNTLTSKSAAFYALPVWYILGFILTVLVLFFLIRFFRSRVQFTVNLK